MSIDCIMRAANLIEPRQKVREAESDLLAALKQNFPVGSEVQWRRGKSLSKGLVVDHGYGDRLFARNYKTGKTVKIGSFEIIAGTRSS